MKICVVGECFNDKYFIGTSTRISPEAPVPVVKISEVKEFCGGGANVRQNLKALGVDTSFYIPQFGYLPTKNRLICDGQQLARWDENDVIEGIPFPQVEWRAKIIECDAVIISDYGKGMFTHELLSWLDAYAHNAGQVFVDTKANPEKFAFLNPIYFPNQLEWSTYIKDYDYIHRAVYKQGANGMSWMEYGVSKIWVPALTSSQELVSVTGAGDTVIAAFAYAYTRSKGNVQFSLEFASKAAAVVVRKPYTATATIEEIEAI